MKALNLCVFALCAALTISKPNNKLAATADLTPITNFKQKTP